MLREACERDKDRLEEELRKIKLNLSKEESEGKVSMVLVETLKERINSF